MKTTNFISYFEIVDKIQYEPKEGHICPFYLICSYICSFNLIPFKEIKYDCLDSNYPKN